MGGKKDESNVLLYLASNALSIAIHGRFEEINLDGSTICELKRLKLLRMRSVWINNFINKEWLTRFDKRQKLGVFLII